VKLARLTYTGVKFYRDREVRYEWQPGDTKLVPESAARKLLRFPVFVLAQGQAAVSADELEQATVSAQLARQEEQDEHNTKESMLHTLEAMDKAALHAYAEKYETKLDKRKAESVLRQEVAVLIEQFGAR
jgi:hypothetical protein